MLTRALDYLNRRGKGLACRLVQLTGKHPERIHPKHLIQSPHEFYLPWLKPCDTVLDLGCGTGYDGLMVEREIDGAVVWWCDRTMPLVGRHAFVQADLEAPLPFKDGSFDAVLMLDVLEHLHNRGQALDEARRVLKPGGLLFLAVPNAGTTWRRRLRSAGLFAFSDPDHKIEFIQYGVKCMVEAAQFNLVTIAPVPALDTPWAGLIDLVGGLHLPTYRRLVEWKRRKALENPGESTGFLVVARTR